jgi:hypothetical protein
MSDRRYSTSAWQRLRKAILARDGYAYQIGGPRCTGHATTVHHIIPSSQRRDLFWSDENLLSACQRCNYSGGRKVAVQNSKQTIGRLYQIIFEQAQEIEQLLDRLAQYEKPTQPTVAKKPPSPAIY